MTPKPEQVPLPGAPAPAPEAAAGAPDGERVVISGMSGTYPDSGSVHELADVLYNKVNPVTTENNRWDLSFPDAAQYTGKVRDLNRFDSQFFKVHHRQSDCMDPMSRKLLEHTYQAIYDAGINPNQLNDKKVAVYIGTSFSEAERGFFNPNRRVGFAITGCSKTMFANRISYWLNLKGPSLSIDESCCSSLAALDQAYQAMVTGGCEAAIVGGTNLFLYPHTTVNYRRVVDLAPDGTTKSFDQNADGFAVSDAINVLFLQKAKDAKRIYADLRYVKASHLSKAVSDPSRGLGYNRDLEYTAPFIKQFYEEAGVSPTAVEYVEAFGSANKRADGHELELLEKSFCGNRKEPLLVGSVMSNVGFTGAASGITAITKVLLGYHRGSLAGNLHCAAPRQDIAALRDGRMRILTDHQPFRRTYAAVNAMSLTGIDAHVLLHGHYKPKDPAGYKASIPRLVTLSGRMDSGVTRLINNLKSRPVDPEEIALLQNIHTTNIPGHLGRGYVILDTKEDQTTVCLGEGVDYFNEGKRPLWFVYSGMGSQWVGMGAQLMRIPIFAAAIERCRRVLAPKGLDILNIITSSDKTMFDNILHSFVGIAAIQIGLTDILRELGLNPDGIIGHSVGELGCGYADGCFTAEEMILAAYSRGKVSLETDFVRGSMAAIGKGFSEISKMCPPEIEVACHNGPESCTISGPADVMREFVADLTAKNIFAKEVPCSNIAFHSRYIAEAGPALLNYLKEVIVSPRPRSSRWVSTSVPQDKWNLPTAQYCSAEYHTNNLLSPVLFEETSALIPPNAVVVEVAPHGLLQAILKRSLPADCRHVPLTRRGHADSALFLLDAIGKLHMEGFTPKIQILYPPVEFPVSTGTPLLSHLVDWIYDHSWDLLNYKEPEVMTAAVCTHIINLHDDEYSYLRGNLIGGNTTFPYAAALVAVWDTFAMSMGIAKKEESVKFQDVYLFSQPILQEQRQLKLTVSMHKGSHYFEITDQNDLKIISGYINVIKHVITEPESSEESNKVYQELGVDADTVYQLLHDRGYSYKGAFRGIESTNEDLSEAYLLWDNNWVTFLDSILQFNVLRRQHDGVSLPTYIESISIDIREHLLHIFRSDNKTLTSIEIMQDSTDRISSGGVSLKGIKFRDLPTASIESEGLELTNLTGSQANNNVSTDSSATHNQMLQCARVGDFDSLHWEVTPEPTEPGVTVTVHYAGLNNFDVGRASGEAPLESEDYLDNNSFGMDFSGVTQSGSRVMGVVRGGACSRRVRARPELLWPVPPHWTLQDAATVPLAYALAFYCLVIKSQLTPGMRILVHGGTGALGQAAISIALAYGCQVFTTVSDVRKKHLLLKLFPQLNGEFIGNSRDHSFGDMVLSATNGQGCHIIINCLSHKLKNISLNCCASFGTVLDTNQIKRQENYNFGMSNLFRSRSYITVDFSSIFADTNHQERQLLQALVSEGVASGWVRPLSRVTYAPCDAPRAFRLLAASQHRGRVLLDLAGDTGTHAAPTPTQPKLICTPDCSQLLICDGDTFALRFADRLISRGARKLCIHHHNTNLSMYYRLKIQFWRNQGIEVKTFSESLDEDKVVDFLSEISRSGPIEGIYVFNTKITKDKNVNYFTSAINALDTISRSLCPQLKYFGIINSGNTLGQQTCVTRAQSNLPGTMISLPDEKQRVTCSVAAVNAAERGVASAQPALAARVPPPPRPRDLAALLAAITGISNFGGLQQDSTLLELGVDPLNIKVICDFLREAFDISLGEDEMSKMKIEEIRDLNATITEFGDKKISSFETFFSFVDNDELIATTDLVALPTLAKGANNENLDFSDEQTELYIIPGLEGHHEKFRSLCERLKLPALVLQPGIDNIHETVQATAERYAKVILKKIKSLKYFYLLGYESGVIVALELASILEKHGLSGTVYIIGYSPEEFQTVLESKICEFESEDQLQNAVIKHMFSIMVDIDSEELENSLRDIPRWEGKLDSCMRRLAGRLVLSSQYTRGVIEAAYARITQARRYRAQLPPLRSQLVLLRAAPAAAATAATAASGSCSLQRYSQQPLVVYELRSPLAHITRDMRCTSLINRHLQPETRDKFENKNQCEIYYLSES